MRRSHFCDRKSILRSKGRDVRSATMDKKRVGRPPGKAFGDLMHVRVPTKLRAQFDAVRMALPEQPTAANAIREAMADWVEKNMKRAKL